MDQPGFAFAHYIYTVHHLGQFKQLTFCKHISVTMDSGIVKLRASVPMRDEVRKQPLKNTNMHSIC